MTSGPATGKILRFLPAPPSADAWSGRLGRPGGPTRVALGAALTLDGLPPPRFAAVEVLWFDDAARRPPVSTTEPIAPATGPATEGTLGGAVEDGTIVLPVDEVVVRGADALADRWVAGGERYKMVSFGRRNPALTRAAFIERWRAEAGRLGGDRIPDEVRGLAYVQDHPVADDPPLDAVNEVWFDELDGLRRRARWFAARPIPADLMSPPDCWSLYLRETVLAP